MKKFIIPITILVLFSILIYSASEAPPALPMEFWGEAKLDGNPVANALNVEAVVNGINYGQPSVTQDGKYSIIITNGDRDLTYNDDPDCSTHNALGEACIPCTPGYGPDHPGHETEYCIEGPQDGDEIVLKVDNYIVKPYVSWSQGSFIPLDVSGITTITIPLGEKWNLLSLPLIPADTSIDNVLQSCAGKYAVIWTTVGEGQWKSNKQYFSPLTNMEYGKSYLVYMDEPCNLTVSGYPRYKVTIPFWPGWNLMGYPSIESRPLEDVVPRNDFAVIWTTVGGDLWKSSEQYFSPLESFTAGRGYESYMNNYGEYNVTY